MERLVDVRNDDIDIVRQLKCVILRTNMIYLDEDIFIVFCRSKPICVSKLLFQLLVFTSVVQFYEGASEQTANNIQ